MNDFLHYAFTNRAFHKIKFIKSLFAKTENEYIKVGKGVYIVSINGKQFELSADTTRPLLAQGYEFTLKKGTFSGVNVDIKTTIGRAINNYLYFHYALDGLIDMYINKQFNYGDIESEFILKNKELIGVKRFKRCGIVSKYLEDLADVFVIPSTLKVKSKPKWLDKYKADVIKELVGKYGEDAMEDKMVYLEYEKRVMTKYHDYLKDDPTYMITTDKKIIDSSLRKKFVGVGLLDTVDPDNKTGVIISSLKDGLPKDKKSFAISINNLVNGSYERGISTKDSGYTSKIIVRAIFAYKIVYKDCGAKIGTAINITKTLSKDLKGMSYINNGKVVKITNENINSLLGKTIILRTAANCKSAGSTLCNVCCGDEISRVPYGVVLLGSETGGMFLKHNLSKFHVTNYNILNIGIKDLIY